MTLETELDAVYVEVQPFRRPDIKRSRSLYVSRDGQFWLSKVEQSPFDFINEWVGYHLFRLFSDTKVVVPRVKLGKKNSLGIYFQELMEGGEVDVDKVYGEGTQRIITLAQTSPHQYSLLLHLLNGDVDRVASNYLIRLDGSLVAFDHAGQWLRPSYHPKMIMLHPGKSIHLTVNDEALHIIQYLDDPDSFKRYVPAVQQTFTPEVLNSIIQALPHPEEIKKSKLESLVYRRGHLNRLVEAVMDGWTYQTEFGGK